ncbi:TOTE conflict system archaeo-eukaryotic primase domain-containing protein [Micromonospora ureilytica]|uniref:TOTE conflict system archaeo-eukaryotic primase domain-containing protein n=1 Tax=Micromonospora ureilytica TaxID=709868 RepID=UPI0040399102
MGSVAEFVDLRREVERLRAENARLARLLELRGQDTSAAPEQLSAPVEPPGLVTMASPTRDKLAMFVDRFRARADVYAVRWDNVRTGAAGWMPAVAAVGVRVWTGGVPPTCTGRRRSSRRIWSATCSWACTR